MLTLPPNVSVLLYRDPVDIRKSFVEQVVDVPEDERTCPECGTPFKPIGEERSESLHFKPMELYVVVQILMKYIAACDCCAKRSAKAESPIKAVDKGVASNSLVAAIAVQKYADHLPLARQSKRLFKRCGVDLPESSMCRWMAVGAELCLPLYLLMKRLLFGGVYVQMDATGSPYLDPAVKGKSCKGTLWEACRFTAYRASARRDKPQNGRSALDFAFQMIGTTYFRSKSPAKQRAAGCFDERKLDRLHGRCRSIAACSWRLRMRLRRCRRRKSVAGRMHGEASSMRKTSNRRRRKCWT